MKTFGLALGVVLTAAMLTVGAAADDWRYLKHTPAYVAGVDAASIQRSGDMGRARLVTVTMGPRQHGVLRALMVMDIEIDCAQSLKRVVQRQAHLSTGEGLEIVRPDGPWEPVPPNTPVAALEAVVCGAQPLDPRSAADLPAFSRLAESLG